MYATVEDKQVVNLDGVADRFRCMIRVYDENANMISEESFDYLLHQRPVSQDDIQAQLDARKSELVQAAENRRSLDLYQLT